MLREFPDMMGSMGKSFSLFNNIIKISKKLKIPLDFF